MGSEMADFVAAAAERLPLWTRSEPAEFAWSFVGGSKRRHRAREWLKGSSEWESSPLIPKPLCLMLLLLLTFEQCMCLDRHDHHHHALLSMQPATSIFGSLLGGGGNNGNSAAQSQGSPLSAADLHQSYKDGQTSDKVTLPGDILLGGLFPIHMKGTKVECGEINRDRGIQRLEAMLYALDRINEDAKLLPGIKLGAILLDSCSSSTYALNQSLEFIRASINTVESSAFECKDKSTPRPKYGSKMIAGVIGGSYSEVSLQVANLLRLFRIPQVSYASTGTALSDKSLYDLFARTVPSDMFQARAIADIVLKLNWSYVSLVSSEGLYGDSGSKEFMKQASVRRICIATHEKISPTIDDSALDSIVASLLKRNATGVVLFTRAEDTRELLLAVKRARLVNNFAWVAADGWGTHQKLVEGVEEVAWGAITVELQAKAIPGFDSYMKALTPWANGRNPWFSEYWQEWFDCQLQANLLQQQQVASGLFSRRAPDQWQSDDNLGSAEARKRRSSSSLANSSDLFNVAIEASQLQLNKTASNHLQRLKRTAQQGINMKQFCSPNLRISETNGYRQEQKVQFVVDAVYAMAHALHKAWFSLCDAQVGVVCEALKELNGGDFYSKYLLNVSFEDLAGSEVKFDERGDGLGRYNIYNYRQVRSAPINRELETAKPLGDELLDSTSGQSAPETETESESELAEGVAETTPISAGSPSLSAVEHIFTSNVEFEYSSIGRWTENDYNLQLNDIQFIQGDPLIPESYCSRPCELGQAKIMRAGDHCCWICKTCAAYEFLPDEFSCRDCGIGRWPIANKTSCYDLPQKYLRWDSIYSLISLSIACLGIALTLFVSIIFIKYLDTPVVKASGRELSFILLAGIAFCHLSTFVLLAKPTTFICGSQRFLVNFGFSLMYASLLVKTNRISRIFNCARKSAKRPSFISPRSQMLITGILVAIQIFLTIVWFVFEAPGIRADSPEGKRDEVILKCRAKGKSFIISLVYNMILITTCTVYAVKTRKIPENFNESKFIGFTMYTTIVIWLAFVTMFFGTNNSYEIQINTMCVCISLSAYVTLFCLFSPKVSIILLHPDKNVRKLTMNSATYKQRPFKPVSSMASVEGRNTTVANRTDGISQGPMSTTSNLLNLDTQTARLQESSTVSAVVNSNSAGSNCSQKTPTTLSQQLTSACANCGARQSISLLEPDQQLPNKAAGSCTLNPKTQQNAKQQPVKSSLSRSSILVSSANNYKPAGTTAKVLHSKIGSQRVDLIKRLVSADDQMLEARNSSPKRKHMASLSKLNELASTTSSDGRHCTGLDGSISSLANEMDSFVNTSQDNTPCNGAHSHNQHQYFTSKGSDSMLWNQSVYSIDYCSDCCPSYCHCSCLACSSSNGHEDNTNPDGGAICVHAAVAAGELQLELGEQLASGADEFEPNCTDQTQQQQQQRPACDNPDEPSTSVHQARRKSDERPPERGYYFGAKLEDSSERKYQEGSKTRRSQTMEMRTIGSDAKLKLRQLTDNSWPNETTSKADQHVAATPVMFALHAAATSALGTVAQVAANMQQTADHNRNQQHYIQFTSSKDKSSERGSLIEAPESASRAQSSARRVTCRQSSAETEMADRDQVGGGGGTIQASIELVKTNNKRRRSNIEQRRHRESSCFDYHDDYEYSYGFVNSNSDSDTCYPHDNDSGNAENIQTKRNDYYEDQDDDFEHDGRVTLNRFANQSASVTTADADSRRQQSRRANCDSTGSKSSASESTTKRASVKEFQLDDHRINSVALIAATLSAGGAIVESSSSSSSRQQQTMPKGANDKAPSAQTSKASGQQKATQQQKHQDCHL